MGRKRKPKGRAINGILLLDKPLDISSNRALQRARAIFNAKKAGHTGSLDPLASGLLPICFGEATKFSNYLLNSDKTYEAECYLGVKTSTADGEGEVIQQKAVPVLTEAEIDAVLQSFAGDYEQLPPMHSALKVNGQPLYKLARQGVEVEREARTVNIYDIELISYQSPSIHFRVSCSKGTYIRTLGEDIGEKLGCGAHIRSLRRVKVGGFDISSAVTMPQLQALRDAEAFEELDNLLFPIETLLFEWPEVHLSSDAAYYLKQGQPVIAPKAPVNGWVSLFEAAQGFIGVGEILDDGRVAPRRLINTA